MNFNSFSGRKMVYCDLDYTYVDRRVVFVPDYFRPFLYLTDC